MNNLNSLLDVYDSLISRENFLARTGKSLNVVTPIQAISGYRFSDAQTSQIHQLIVSFAQDAERMAPGSFLGTLEWLRKFSNNYIAYSTTPIIYDYSRASSINGEIPSHCDIDAIINFHCGSDIVLKNMLLTAIDYVGNVGRIAVEKSNNDTDSVEYVVGYKFNSISDIPEKYINCKVSVIDGYIDSVSEVHKLFTRANETKISCVIFCRGAAEDVRNTAVVNHRRGTMNVNIVVLPFDLDGINTIADIAAVCGCKPTSTATGDLIFGIDFDELPLVESIVVDGNSTTIKCARTFQNVEYHKQEIRKKMKDCVDDLRDLYIKRLKSLNSNSCVIRIANNLDFVSRSQKLDYAIRAYKSAIEYGVVKNNDNIKLAAEAYASKKYASACIQKLRDIYFSDFPGII